MRLHLHLCGVLLALPVLAVKELATHKEWLDLLAEAKVDGRPVIVDFYSQSCGPCHMIAPVFRKVSKEYAGRAYFRKVDIDRNRQTASAQGVRSMPTFQFFMKGKKRHTFSGADEASLREWTRRLVEEFERDDIEVTRESLEAFYKKHDPAKATKEGIDRIIEKNSHDFGTMVRLLKKKYGEAPVTKKRERAQKAGSKGEAKPSPGEEGTCPPAGAALQTASLSELKEELERREEDAMMERAEQEERRLAHNPCSLYRNRTAGKSVEKVVIVGGGPAGMTAAIYAARANLCPLLIAPAMGGQLMAKGVDVENYPGMPRENGGRMIEIMKKQARSFFTEVWDDSVISVDASKRPFEIVTNRSGVVRTHTVIVATGADSRWLNVEGEWELRGRGVSSCAACDGYLFKGKTCAVVGGGDSAMEEALMLARICSHVHLIHRRDSFRASSVLQERVLANQHIRVRWNSTIARYVGKTINVDGEEQTVLGHLELYDPNDESKKLDTLHVDATFIAIGHDPNTGMLAGQVDMDNEGYVLTSGKSTKTSTLGIFAAGDVVDNHYMQAVTSTGSGAMAALDAEHYLDEYPIEDEETVIRQEDFSDWSLKDLRAQATMLGVRCVACTEKSDFVTALKSVY